MEWGSASFGAELRERRTHAGLTQRELANRAGVSVRAVRYIESGRVERPRRESVLRLAEAIGLSLDPDSGPVDRIWIGVLGRLELTRGRRAVDIGPLKQRCLLALLALQPNKVVSQDEIVDQLWGEWPPDSSHNLVHTYVSRLRKVLEPASATLTSAPHGGYLLSVAGDQLDLMRFDELAGHARAARSDDPHAAVLTFEQALGCWRGPTLADLPANLRHHPLAISVAAQRVSVALEYADTVLELGLPQERVVDQLRLLVSEEPMHEGLHARLMLALAASGQQAAALRVFAAIRARLDEDLGVTPGTELANAHLEILRHDLPPVSSARPVLSRSRPIPAQLPADVTGFAGRTHYLDQLDAILSTDPDTAVVISAIAGTAGVGKTALAVHWAHRARNRFPDGQLFVNLRGYAPGLPVRPLEVLTRFLRALGIPAERVPSDEEEASSLYRTELSDRKLLIVLDNAASPDQVRPLLPGSPGCLVLVTSRDRLTGLVATEGAHRLTLDVLDPTEAHTLLARMIGEDRVLAEPEAVAELCAMCAFLPLALRISAAKIAISPVLSVSQYSKELRERGRLGELTIDSDEDAVRAAFDLSYARLESDARRLFRLLGLVPGPDFTPDATAALAGARVPDIKRLLGHLEAAHLVQQHLPGRYQFHDLLREYARELACGDKKTDVDAAIERWLDFHLQIANAATRLLYPFALRFADLPIATGVGFVTEGAALNWLESERTNLVAAAVHASDHGIARFSWRLVDTLRGYFSSRGHGVDGIAICRAALAAAELSDDVGEASTQDVLGLIHYNLGNYRDSIDCHTRALTLGRRTGNPNAEANSLHNLGRAHSNLGGPARAARCHEQAVRIYRRIGNLHGQAHALNYVGTAKLSLGQLDTAIAYHRRALNFSRKIGDRDVEARSLHGLGLDYFALGDLDRAIACYSDCLKLARTLGNKPGESITLNTLGEAHCEAGRYREALDFVSEGLGQAREIGDRRSEVRGLEILATIHQRQNDYDPADRYYSQALKIAREIEYFYGESSVLIGYSATLRSAGRLAEGAEACQQALAVIHESGTRLFEGNALTELAHVRVELGDPERAEIHVKQALEVVRKRGQQLVEARALFVLGRIREANGQLEDAQAHWDAALEIFSRIGSPQAHAVRVLLGA